MKECLDELENKKVKYLKGDASYGAVIEVCITIFSYLINLVHDGNKRSGDAPYRIDETPRPNQLEDIRGNLYDIIGKLNGYLCPICKEGFLYSLNPLQHKPDYHHFRCNKCNEDFKIPRKAKLYGI